MSPRCQWLILCDRVIVDHVTQQLNLMGCLENIAAPVFPSVYTGFACAARFVWPEGGPDRDLSMRFRLVRLEHGAEEREVAVVDGAWAAHTLHARVFVQFQQLNLLQPGPLGFRVDFAVDGGEWERGADAWLQIEQAKLTAEQQAQLQSQMQAMAESASARGDER